MANKHGDFFWYELMTSDADAAQAFYGPMLGWDFSGHPAPGMDYRTFAKGDEAIGGLMPLTAEMTEHGARPLWTGYIFVDDVDATASAITDKGGSVMMPANDIPDVGRIAMVADPSGAPFYIMKPSRTDGESNAFAKFAPAEGHCAWNELLSGDQAGADAFYTSLFGWEKADSMDMGDLGAYDMYRAADYTLGAIMQKTPDMPVSLWSYYFRVSEINAAADYLTAKGGQVINGPMEIPGGDFVLNGIDPQGAMFALIGKG